MSVHIHLMPANEVCLSPWSSLDKVELNSLFQLAQGEIKELFHEQRPHQPGDGMDGRGARTAPVMVVGAGFFQRAKLEGFVQAKQEVVLRSFQLSPVDFRTEPVQQNSQMKLYDREYG